MTILNLYILVLLQLINFSGKEIGASANTILSNVDDYFFEAEKPSWAKLLGTNGKDIANVNSAAYDYYIPKECEQAVGKNQETKQPPDQSNQRNEEVEDIVYHVTKLMKSMREHTVALIKNMNELEADISSSLSSSSEAGQDSDLKTCDEDTKLLENTITHLTYPDITNQELENVNKEWPSPITNSGVRPLNDFVQEAQDAVRSWKSQIEECKALLASAVDATIHESNHKTKLIRGQNTNLTATTTTTANEPANSTTTKGPLTKDYIHYNEKPIKSVGSGRFKAIYKYPRNFNNVRSSSWRFQ